MRHIQVIGLLAAGAFTALATAASAQTFVSLGPNGEVSRFAIAPSSGSTLLAMPGGDGGGLFLSTNAGSSWTSITPGICDVHVEHAAFHPTTPSTIFAATISGGVCRSTDSGATWTALTNGLPVRTGTTFPEWIHWIEINPSTPATMLAATEVGVYRSTDGGATWSAALAQATTRQVVISKSTPSVAFASTPFDVYKSTDNGATWSVARSGLPTGFSDSFLTIDPANPNVVYLSTTSTDPDVNVTGFDVFKTTNGGTLWTPIGQGLGTPFFVTAVTVDPGNSNTLYINAVGGLGFARSTNGGSSWSSFSTSGLPSLETFPNVYEVLMIDPGTPTRFYAGSLDGMYRSTNSGATFSPINTNLAALMVKAPALIPGTGGGAGSLVMNASTVLDGGDILKLTGGGLPLTRLGSPFSANESGSGDAMAADPVNPNTLYVVGGQGSGNSCSQPYKSTDGGATWTVINGGLPAGLCAIHLAVDPNAPSTLFLAVSTPTGGGNGFVGIYKSTNGGSTWAATPSTNGAANRVAVSPLRSSVVYAGVGSFVLKSTNGGTSWANVNSGLPSGGNSSNFISISRIAIDPTNDDIVYVGTSAGVYRTANGGSLWTARTTNWPALSGSFHSVGALAIDPNTPTTLYAAPARPLSFPSTQTTRSAIRGVGLYRSTDSGATWTALTGDISGTVVNDVVFDGNRAIFATTGNGVFRASLTSTATVSLSRSALTFAATTTGTAFASQTAEQTVQLTVGGGTASWTAASDKPWLTVSPASGSGSGTLTIAVKFDASLPASGTVTGNIALSLTGAANTAGPIAVTLNVVPTTAPAASPFGSFDTPAGDATVLAGSVAVTGWTLDNIGVRQVELWRDVQAGETTPPYGGGYAGDPRAGKIFIANAVFTDGARPDVEGLYPTTPANHRAGWGYLMLTWGLFGQGNGTYRLHAFAVDQENNTATIGSKSIIVSNNTATKPFGSIDTPTIGGDPGTSPNFGWGLTPKVNGAATCKIQSNGVQVSIDSGPLQPVVYGTARADIAGAFPGFSNSAAAGGHFIFDWSTLTNGPHTIGWLITDDCGRADGVGSRFFNVTTGTNLVAAPAAAIVPAFALRVAETESNEPLLVARGYGELPEIVDPGLAGSRTIEMKQGERIELRTPRGYEAAYQVVGGQKRALPAGSTWDADSGIFYWQPAPGFLGRYRLVFSNGRERINVRVVVTP
jgi:hypothetical protein